MRSFSWDRFAAVAIIGVLGVFGCGPGVPTLAPDTESGTGSDSNATTSTTSSSDPPTATLMSDSLSSGSEDGSSTGIVIETSSTGDAPDETSTGIGSTTTGPPDPTTTTGGGLPNGDMCMANPECASGMCFLAGILGGICGECLTEDDCDWGCSIPNPLSTPAEGAMCSDGEAGGGCNTDDACDNGLVCNAVVDIPGVLSASTCGDCVDDGDCPGQLCSPDVDIAALGGTWECVNAGSQLNGDFCDLEGSGNQSCSTGFCAAADIMGLVEFGICSDCSNVDMPDEGCLGVATCQDPTIALDGMVVPGTCV